MGELSGKDTASVVELQNIGVESFWILHLHVGSKLAIISSSFLIAAARCGHAPNGSMAALMALIASIFSVVVMLQKFVPLRVLLMCVCVVLYPCGFKLNLCRLVIECLCGNIRAL